jgi:hypothetical protein
VLGAVGEAKMGGQKCCDVVRILIELPIHVLPILISRYTTTERNCGKEWRLNWTRLDENCYRR